MGCIVRGEHQVSPRNTVVCGALLQTLATGRAEWLETPKPTVWEAGPDAIFWLSSVLTIIFAVITVGTYREVARLTRKRAAVDAALQEQSLTEHSDAAWTQNSHLQSQRPE